MTNETNEFMSLAQAVVRNMISTGVDLEIIGDLAEEDRAALFMDHMVKTVEKENFLATTYRNDVEFKEAFRNLIFDSFKK